jgi:transposase
VRHWIKHSKDHIDVNEMQGRGRKRKASEANEAAIVAEAQATIFTTPRRIRRKLGLDLSVSTIDRILIRHGLFGRVARHKHTYTAEEKAERLKFARDHEDWSKDAWMQVIFADEKQFLGEGFAGQVWCRRPPGEALNPDYCVDHKPHPVNVNFWGCMSGHGVGYCYIFNDTMDGRMLRGILGDNLIASAKLWYDVAHAEDWRFLQDNDPKHRSNIVCEWLFNHGVQRIIIPPYSPDLNPIEHLWAKLARRVERRAHECATMEQLQDVVAEEWEKIKSKKCRKLARSMRKRCKAVIKANGDHTKY